MKTKITRNIDGVDVIFGLGDAQIDPVATQPIMIEALKLTDEYKLVEDKKAEMQVVAQSILQAQIDFRKTTSQAEKSKLTYEYQKSVETLKGMESAIALLAEPLILKQKELMQSCAVYFTPAQGETVISDEEAEKIVAALNTGKIIDKDLNEVDDNRGRYACKYSGKWFYREITKLGDACKSGETFLDALSESDQAAVELQMEKDRVATLTAKAKMAEMEAAIAKLVADATAMRSALEIQGDADALAKSQDYYNTELEKINQLYV